MLVNIPVAQTVAQVKLLQPRGCMNLTFNANIIIIITFNAMPLDKSVCQMHKCKWHYYSVAGTL